MAKDQYPAFDGWTVAKGEGPNGRHEFTFTKDHEGGKGGQLLVKATIGADNDPHIAYLAGRMDAYAEDVRVGEPEAEAKHAAAYKDVVAGKVQRRIAKGFDTPADAQKYAVDRLSEAGFSLSEIATMMGG